MGTERDSVRTAPRKTGVASGTAAKKTRGSKNGRVESRNHLDDLSPSLRDYVLDRCRREGISVMSVRVVSETEVIFP